MGRWGGALALRGALGVWLAGCAAVAPVRREAPTVDATAVLETVPATGVGETVLLRFAWPEVLDGRCASRLVRAGSGGAARSESTYGLRAEHDGDHIRIRTFEVQGGLESDPALPLDTALVVDVVDRRGRHLGFEGIDAALEAMPQFRGASDAQRHGLAEALRGRLARNWKLTVGAWVDRELPLGATYAASAPEAVEGGGSVRMRIAIRADGRIPCHPGAAERRCVRLHLRSQPDDERVEALAPALLRELVPERSMDPRAMVVQGVAAVTDVTLVTEPDTLVPYRLTTRRYLAIRGSTLDEPDFVRELREEATRVCRWER
jgi:hypothetical protein